MTTNQRELKRLADRIQIYLNSKGETELLKSFISMVTIHGTQAYTFFEVESPIKKGHFASFAQNSQVIGLAVKHNVRLKSL